MGKIDIQQNILSLQSSELMLIAAGARKGVTDNSASGVHLRWLFNGYVGSKHLPKGDLDAYSNSVNFDRSRDFVRLYRADYNAIFAELDLSLAPRSVNGDKAQWVYNQAGKVFYVNFDKNRYDAIKNNYSWNPFTASTNFINAYGNYPIEIEVVGELFFGVKMHLALNGGNAQSSSLELETCSAPDNGFAEDKFISSRKTYSHSEYQYVHVRCENGKSVRFRTNNAALSAPIYFEFYSDSLMHYEKNDAWIRMGEYALSLDRNELIERLSVGNEVDGYWPRFVDGNVVHIPDYISRWFDGDHNICEILERYINISAAEGDNPTAEFPMDPNDPETTMSALDLLNFGAFDFHIARMLGLGTIDAYVPYYNQKYIYAVEYISEGLWENEYQIRRTQHIGMSIPVSLMDERLPLPVEIESVVPGIVNSADERGQMTDDEGYTHDGRSRYVTLIAKPCAEDFKNAPFFDKSNLYPTFNYSETTFPIFGGVRYAKGSAGAWIQPELSFDYEFNQVIPRIISEDNRVLYIHKQRENGRHIYGSYGINIFSRATPWSGSAHATNDTVLVPADQLTPPVNINAFLIQEENPPFLTSAGEQTLLANISGNDKTLVRLTFDYHTQNDMFTYKVDGQNIQKTDAQLLNDSTIYPDNLEDYADEALIFFRKDIPGNVIGKASGLVGNTYPSDEECSISTEAYSYASSNNPQIYVPKILPADVSKYVGGVMIIGDQQLIIKDITPSATNPVITVYKEKDSDLIDFSDDNTSAGIGTTYKTPDISTDGLFMLVENMQNTSNWGTHNPHTIKVKIGHNWSINREIFYTTNSNNEQERFLEKSRGFWKTATIEAVSETIADANNNPTTGYKGLYKITFPGFTLPQHQQQANKVEFHNGIIRLKRKPEYANNGERTVFEVIKMNNSGNSLVLYIQDPQFVSINDANAIKTGTGLSVNYYPGYKVYLYANANHQITASNIMPAENEGTRYSIFGLKSSVNSSSRVSKMSSPALMFAQEKVKAERPGGLTCVTSYATRPDFYGKSTYSFTVPFNHIPANILFCRADDALLLNALYKTGTVAQIKTELENLGGNSEEFLAERWQNFFNFDGLTTANSYGTFPASNGFAFPLPDNDNFITAINSLRSSNLSPLTSQSLTSLNQIVVPATGLTLLDCIKEVVYTCFIPLTEFPVTYKHIRTADDFPNYKPLPKKQSIRDRNGYLLHPESPEFDMAPMAKVVTTGTTPRVLFTDFTLDGTTNNIYFYAVREMDNQMLMSDFSPFTGPVKLVNSNPPEAPQVKSIIPVMSGLTLDNYPFVEVEVNAYPENQNICKIALYRTTSQEKAQSVLSMEKVAEIDLESENMLSESTWKIRDDFSDLQDLPYREQLFYRVTASRKIEYSEGIGGNAEIIEEYAPSLPSKLLGTMIVDSNRPTSPTLNYSSGSLNNNGEISNVIMRWQKTMAVGTYHLYKMTEQGNWKKIKEISSSEGTNGAFAVPLANTDLNSGVLCIRDGDNNTIYHHFKVMSENSSGMFSEEENILTIDQANII